MTDQVTTRVCSKCKVDKTFDSFGKDASKKQGIRSQCNICNKEAANAWREANPEKVKAATKAWYEANPEKAKARSKAWREANPERVKAATKAWRKANPEKAKARSKAWRKANPEKAKAMSKAWREANPEKAKAMSKAWREANPERLKAIRKAYVNRLTDAYVAGLLAINRDQCPQELIELKRINVLITREIRKQQCQN